MATQSKNFANAAVMGRPGAAKLCPKCKKPMGKCKCKKC